MTGCGINLFGQPPIEYKKAGLVPAKNQEVKMAEDYITGERQPRRLIRRRGACGGEKIFSCAYFNLSRVPLHSSETEYKRMLTEFSKMAGAP